MAVQDFTEYRVTHRSHRYNCARDPATNKIIKPEVPDYDTLHVNEEGSNVKVRQIDIVNPEKESRPRPPSLFGEVTDRGPFHVKERSAGVFFKHKELTVSRSGLYISEEWDYQYLLPDWPTIDPSEDDRRNTEHNNKVNRLTQDASGMMADLHKSASGFQSLGGKAVDIYKAIKGKGGRRRKLTVCDVATTQLAVNYGVKPLVSDVYDMVDGIRNKNESGIRHKVYTPLSYSGVTEGNSKWNFTRSVENRSYVMGDGDAPAFHIGHPTQILWEAIPYSFVLDWVVGVGDYIAASHFPRTLKLLGHCTTYRLEATLQDYTAPEGWVTQTSPEGYVKSYNRVKLSGLPPPTPLQWDPTKSLKAVSNGIALLTNLRDTC